MASKRKKKGAVKEAVTTVVVMRLYIAGRAPNSVKAIANLEAICRQHLKDSYKLEIVDVCEHPRRALDDGILVTPASPKCRPHRAPMSSAISVIPAVCWPRWA